MPSAYKLTAANGFSNGLALVTFQDNTSKKTYTGFIDTGGRLRNYIEGSYSDSQNKSGYIYINKNNVLTVITPDGKTNAYALSSDLKLKAYGDGYVVTEEHKAGFEAVEYVYHIYDGAGKELTSYSSGSKEVNRLSYVGEGIFCFNPQHDSTDEQDSYGYDVWYGDLYFARSNTWLKEQLVGQYVGNAFADFSCQDGVFMFRGGSHDNSSDNTHRGEFTYANSKGELQTITVPAEYGTKPRYMGHAGGMILFVDNDFSHSAVYYYDTGTGSWSIYQGQYTDRLDTHYYFPTVGDGHIAICLKGADNAIYTMLLDKNMAEVLDAPVSGYPYAIRDGVLYTTDGGSTMYCYDLKGKLLAEIPNADTSRNWLEEGIIATNQGELLKTDGTPAFSEVDFSTGSLITLP